MMAGQAAGSVKAVLLPEPETMPETYIPTVSTLLTMVNAAARRPRGPGPMPSAALPVVENHLDGPAAAPAQRRGQRRPVLRQGEAVGDHALHRQVRPGHHPVHGQLEGVDGLAARLLHAVAGGADKGKLPQP